MRKGGTPLKESQEKRLAKRSGERGGYKAKDVETKGTSIKRRVRRGRESVQVGHEGLAEAEKTKKSAVREKAGADA